MAFARGAFVGAFHGFGKQAEKRLEILDVADSLTDLGALQSNRLEALRGGHAGQHSIRINAPWGIGFECGGDGPENVEITDYH